MSTTTCFCGEIRKKINKFLVAKSSLSGGMTGLYSKQNVAAENGIDENYQ